MAKCPGLFPIIMLLSVLLSVSTIARAADEPVATAAIPPPLPAAPPASSPAVPKAAKAPTETGAVATPAKPSSGALSPAALAARKATGTDSPKRTLRPAALSGSEPAKRAVAPKSSRHAKRERHIVVARAYPKPAPARPRYYYPGAPVSDPDNGGPPWPPQWYERGRPLAGYPYPPPPRGPW